MYFLVQLTKFGDHVSKTAKDIAKVLVHEDYKRRGTAQDTLEGLGPQAASAVLQVGEALVHDDDACSRALKVLLKVGSMAGAAGPQIAKCLAHDDKQIRKISEGLLLQLGKDGASAVPELGALLRLSDATSYESVLAVLAGLGADAGAVSPEIAKFLTYSEEADLQGGGEIV